MKGILKNSYYLLEVDVEVIEEGEVCAFMDRDVITFEFNEEVEILKVINDKSYLSGIAYVIINRNNDSMTIDSAIVELIEGDSK